MSDRICEHGYHRSEHCSRCVLGEVTDLRARLAAAEERAQRAEAVQQTQEGRARELIAEAEADRAHAEAHVETLKARVQVILGRLADESMEAEDYSPVEDLKELLK